MVADAIQPDDDSEYLVSKLKQQQQSSSSIPDVTTLNTTTIHLPDRRVFLDDRIMVKNSLVCAEYKNSFIEFRMNEDNRSRRTRSSSCPPGGPEPATSAILTGTTPHDMYIENSPYASSSLSSPWGTTIGIFDSFPPPHMGNVGGPITTYMIRNIPTRFTSITFVRLLEDYGFGKTFDFFYLPMDFRSGKNMGYAFINFKSAEIGEKFCRQFNGKRLPVSTSKKVVDISPYRRQGLVENVSLFRTSDLLNSVSLPHYKPLVAVDDGTLVPLSDINFVIPPTG
jgi:hypothetical protein